MPDLSQQSFTLNQLLQLMERLRSPEQGCPWAREQSFRTIAPYTLEEAYEVVDAIEADDLERLPAELGDLLLQVIYHAQMASEQGAFDFSDVVTALGRKLLRRNPWLAEGSSPPGTSVQAQQLWQSSKQQEQHTADQAPASVLAAIPSALPALVVAQKLQDRAAQVNFDWPDIKPVLAKLREELDEIEQAIDQGDQQQVAAEVGDFLFAATNMARHLKVDAEQAVRGCNQKFRRRFGYIEQQLQQQGRSLESCTLAQLDALWDEAKQRERE